MESSVHKCYPPPPTRDWRVNQDDQERKETWETQESPDEMWDTHLWIIIRTVYQYSSVLPDSEEAVQTVSLSASLLICVWSQGSPGPAGLRGEKGEVVCYLLYFYKVLL